MTDTTIDERDADFPSFRRFGGSDAADTGFDAAGIVVLPLPYERGPSYGAGSRSGPLHLLAASAQLETLDEETRMDWGRLGLHTLPPPELPPEPEAAVRCMYRSALPVLRAEKFLLSLGGDHAVSIGPVQAASEVFPDLGVLQIDAHTDLRDTWNGSRLNHACVMRRIVDDLHLPIVQVGIRSFSPEEADFMDAHGLHPIYAHQIDPANDDWIDRAVAALPRRVYLTLDLDGLDPSVIPGTGTPEPGGLSYRQVVALMRRLGKCRRVVAADITELAKVDGMQVSEFTAAKLATKIMIHCAG